MLLLGILAQISKKMTKIRGLWRPKFWPIGQNFVFLKNFRNFPKHPPSFVALAQIAIENETLHTFGTPRVQTFFFFLLIFSVVFFKKKQFFIKNVKDTYFQNNHQTKPLKKILKLFFGTSLV